ncbi:MAG TPA: hypothetical protein VM510_10520 [Caulifigura sp.]|nr:hypothetical protein [Caulifigura sp.]
MSSRLMGGIVVCCAASIGTALSYAWADGPSLKKPVPLYGPAPLKPESGLSNTTPSSPFPPPAFGDAKPAKSSRILFESNWKNVQVGAKPMYFRQGDKSFVWTVKNTGAAPVEVGDDYGFSIAPGEEESIVDTRLVLTVANDQTTTVEVKASRVMTQSELTAEPKPTPVYQPVNSATYGAREL